MGKHPQAEIVNFTIQEPRKPRGLSLRGFRLPRLPRPIRTNPLDKAARKASFFILALMVLTSLVIFFDAAWKDLEVIFG